MSAVASDWRAVCFDLAKGVEDRVQTLPEFRVLKRGEQPPEAAYHILLVHRISADKRALVHEITGHLPESAQGVRYL